LRILLVTDAWFPQINGVVRALSTTRDRLVERGHEVEVLAPDRFKSVPAPTYPEIRLALCTPNRAGRIIEDFQPDAVHIATEGPLGLCARHWLKKRNVEFTTSFHTLFPQYLKFRFGIPERWTFSGLRWFHNAGSATMYNTPTLREMLASHGFSRLARWVRGVDTKLFRPVTPAELNLPRPIQLYVGRVAVEKTLEAFLVLDTPGSKVVIGDGPARRKLEANFPETIFLGPRFDENLVAAYCAADVFVFPSRTDTLGLVMLEAMACGIPVAAFPVHGPLDVVADSGAGRLNEDLAQAIRDALGIDPRICRQRALEHSWDQSVVEFSENLALINWNERSPGRR
jgi:glycosyltransferase involved in cell wall biosynthesis